VELDPLLLSRIQFAFVVSFHILFPAFTIGLATYIAVLEILWAKTGQERYGQLSDFWTKIFAVSFGMGVVSGIVMSYQFGTNWSRFSEITGNVLGPLMSYEVVTAFFLEATFLGIMLFGRNRVPRALHVTSACMVALGTLISTFWILSANSWMHTPAGYEFRDGVFYVQDWWRVIFNPSFPYRLAHMGTAAFLTTAFVVCGVSAWHLLRGRFRDTAGTAFSMGMGLITVLAPAQLVIGDLHGLNTFEHQPAKVAAMEGHWESQRGAPLLLFAVPDVEAERNRWVLEIPKLGSLILTHELEGEVRGLKAWPPDERPWMPIVFYSFRVMVGIGLLMIAVGFISFYLRLRRRLLDTPWFLRLSLYCTPIGFIAILAGWFTTETGRQPWVVYGVLRTAEAVSPAVTGGSVLASLVAFFVAYAVIFGAGIYYIFRMVRSGPVGPQHHGGISAAKRPLSASDSPLSPPE
jgi:cytochrome d ubiquinol oxidase subunit I